MSRRSTRQNADWSRCSEGFSDIIANANTKPAKETTNKSTKDSFSHGNIFEKLAFCTEETSQSITWSSSDDEQSQPVVKVEPEKASGGNKAKTGSSVRRKRKKSSPRGRSVRKKLNSHVQVDSSEVLEIKSDSDAELVNSNVSVSECSEAAIKAYDSGTEEGSTQQAEEGSSTRQAEPSQVTSTQESPSIVDTGSSTSPVSQTGTGVKASDWVKTLQLKTPSKSDSQSTLPAVDDSTKKKKKFHRGGLADRLNRLVARDKSTVRMWSHQMTKPSPSQDSKAVSLTVCGYETLYSLQAVRCQVLPGQPEATGGQDPGPSGSGAGGQEEKLVMFPASQAEQLKLQLGTRLKIFPPWQQLELQDGREILLCTKYCQVVSQPGDVEPAGTEAITPAETRPEEVSAVWNCPCVQGLCRNQTLCPAYQFPSVPGWIKIPASSSAAKPEGKDDNSNELKHSDAKVPPDKSSSHLHTVSRSAGSLPEEPVFDSLLESIESGRTAVGNDSGEERNTKVASFKGYVHRAVWNRKSSGCKSCCLLVEDGVGMVCEVRLTADTLARTGTGDPAVLEGKTFLFSGLKLADRLVRQNDPCLFTMMDHVWSGKTSRVDSQDLNFTQGDLQDWSFEQPGYCYVLSAAGLSGDDVKLDPCPQCVVTSRDPVYSRLTDLSSREPQPARCSCVARAVFVHSRHKNPADHVLYVTDSSLRKPHPYVKVKIQSACDFPSDTLTKDSSSKPVLLLRDLYIDKGMVYADGYTSIVNWAAKQDENAQQSQELFVSIETLQRAPVLPDLRHSMQPGDLCALSGIIHEVDEDSAYSWETCTKCGGERLQEGADESLTKCLMCGHTMVEPKTMMKMEVTVQCDRTGSRVKVDLLQATIEVLLPPEEADEDGFELTSILRKSVGPLSCLVTSTHLAANKHRSFVLKEIELL